MSSAWTQSGPIAVHGAKSPFVWEMGFWSIVAWETLTAAFFGWGAVELAAARSYDTRVFPSAAFRSRGSIGSPHDVSSASPLATAEIVGTFERYFEMTLDDIGHGVVPVNLVGSP